MDNKKFKILAIVDAVIIVALIVLMMVLKGNYNDQAQASVKEQVGAFQESANSVLQELWKSVDQNGMAWKLVYATITGDKTEKSFNAASQVRIVMKGNFIGKCYEFSTAGIAFIGEEELN